MPVAVRGKASIDAVTGTPSTLTVSLNTLTDEGGSAAAAQAGDVAVFWGLWNNGSATLSLNRTMDKTETQIQFSTTYTGGAWSRRLTSTDISNNTVQLSSSSGGGRCAFGVIVLSDVDATTALDPVSPNPAVTSQSNPGDTTLPYPGIDPTNLAFLLCVAAWSYANGVTAVSPAGTWTELVDEICGHGSGRVPGVYGMRYSSNPTSSSIGGGNLGTLGAGLDSYGASWTYAFAPASAAHSDNAALAGVGTLTTVEAPALAGTAALSGAGTLAGAVVPAVATTAGLGGDGSLSATGTPAVPTAAGLSGDGALTAAASAPAAVAAAGLAGSGTLTAAVEPAIGTTSALSGAGVLSTVQTLATATTAALAGDGTLSTTVQTLAVAATAALSGAGTLSATATLTGAADAALAGAGTLSAAASSPAVASTAAFAGTGSLTATGTPAAAAAAALSGVGALTAGAVPHAVAAAVLSGSGTLVATSLAGFAAAAELAGLGVLTALGIAGVRETVPHTSSIVDALLTVDLEEAPLLVVRIEPPLLEVTLL